MAYPASSLPIRFLTGATCSCRPGVVLIVEVDALLRDVDEAIEETRLITASSATCTPERNGCCVERASRRVAQNDVSEGGWIDGILNLTPG
jgi:hypothetical protein